LALRTGYIHGISTHLSLCSIVSTRELTRSDSWLPTRNAWLITPNRHPCVNDVPQDTL